MNQHLTSQEVCKALKCSDKTFYRLIKAKDPLPAYKLGDGPRAEWRTDPDELQAWIERRKHSGPGDELTRRRGPQGRKPKQQTRGGRSWKMVIPDKKRKAQ